MLITTGHGERAMTIAASERRYRSTESKYKGGAHEMYVTDDLEQKTQGGQSALYHKVKRIYIAGEVRDWRTGRVRRRRGVTCTAYGSNMNRPVRATVEKGTRRVGTRQHIL
jgi:hypothetical protein